MTSKAKKFIKKLMAFGYAKNDAVLLQQYAVKSIFSEKEHKLAAYECYAPKLKSQIISYDKMEWIK